MGRRSSWRWDVRGAIGDQCKWQPGAVCRGVAHSLAHHIGLEIGGAEDRVIATFDETAANGEVGRELFAITFPGQSILVADVKAFEVVL